MFEATKKLNELEKMVGNCSPTDQITDFAFEMSEQISKFAGDPTRTIETVVKIIDNLVDTMGKNSNDLSDQIEKINSALNDQINKLNQESAEYKNAIERLVFARDKIRPFLSGKSAEGSSSREYMI